ncbi:hypothetical protein ACFOSC_26445 [Streptantibioticus rubrisoli]|uniref:Uncharacterized protein n=1 Tax=Streptantibioticus rubrisoli TaxID=1387313 RepID=A0ABT1PEU5_9ACTN|nr:hypothetical protein [Streptantibioticus rubrisoli]MCQ4043882.1 hypothetical protein [Streptantibioticus rubrisoli]
MLHLFMRPQTGRQTTRRFLSTVSDAVRSLIAPASLTRHSAPSQPAPVAAPEPTGLFTADELPDVEDIEAAAASFAKAADQARAADRGKRKAKRLLDRLPAGIYGGWVVSRVTSTRQTADLDEIRRIFKQHGLGPVPMKPSAPSLKVERVPAAELVTV